MRRALSAALLFLAVAALIVVTATLVQVLDREFQTRLAELKESTVALLEGMLGRKISYESISPSLLQYIDVRNLSIYDPTDPPHLLLNVRDMRISYSLYRLIIDRDPIGSLNEISIANSVFDIDRGRDQDVSRLLSDLLSAGGKGKVPHLRISGANVSLNVTFDGAAISFTNLFFKIGGGIDAFNVSFRGGANGSLGSGFDFHTSLKVEGRIGKLFDWSDLTFRVFSFSSSVVNMGAQTLQLVWKGDSIEVDKLWDRSPINLQFLADTARNVFTLSFQAENFRPDDFFEFSGWMKKYQRWLDSPLTASGYVTYNLAQKSFDYRADLSASLPDQLPVHDLSVTARLSGSEKKIDFEPLSVVSPLGEAEFTGDILLANFFPQGQLTVSNIEAIPGEPIDAELSLERLDGSLNVTGNKMVIGGTSFDPFDLTVVPAEDGGRFHFSTAFTGTEHPNGLQADGVLTLGEKPRLSLVASLTDAPPAGLLLLLTGPKELSTEQRDIAGILSQFTLSSDLSLMTDFSNFHLTSKPTLFRIWDDPQNRLECSLSIDQSSILISDFSGVVSGRTIKGDFRGGISRDGRITFSSQLTFQEIPYAFSGSYSQGEGLAMTGSYGLDAAVTFMGGRGYALRSKADRMPLPVDGIKPVSFRLEGEFPNVGDWWVSCPSLTVYDLPIPRSPTNTLALSLMVVPDRIIVSQARFTDSLSVLEGNGNATYQIATDPLDPHFLRNLASEFNLDLKGRESTETYNFKGTLKDGALNMQTTFSGMPLTRIGNFALSGALNGSALLNGPLSSPAISVSAALADGKLGIDPISLSTSLDFSGGRLTLKSVSLGYLSHKLLDSFGVLQLDQGTYTFTTRYQGEYFGDRIEATARLDGQIKAESWENVTSDFFNSAVRGKLTVSYVTVNGNPSPPWSMDLRTENRILYFDGGPQSSLHGTFNSQNAFTIALNSPLPVIGKAAGKFRGDRIESTVDIDMVDMRVLNPILKSPIITVTSGVVSGQLMLAGPISDPDYTGELQLIGGGITCIYAADEAGPVSTSFTFNGKMFSFPVVFTSAGKARLSGSGTFAIDHWVPISFTLNLKTENQTAVHLVGRFGAVRTDGYATGEMKIVGDDRHTEVTGAIVASDCRISLGPPPTGRFVPEDPPTFLSMKVQTGRRVEFQWPSTDLPVVRAMAKAGSGLTVTYRGDTGAYTVKGITDIQGGEVFYFDRNFVLKRGRIAFDETEAAFDPRITVRAEVREWDPRASEEVKIYLDADNKLSAFSPRFSSDPPKSDVDILAMIGAPILLRAGSTGPWGLANSAYYLGTDVLQFFLLRPFEQQVRELLGVDTFSLRTQILQNWLAQRLFGSNVNPLDNTSLSLGKYLGNDLFWEVSLSLQSPPNSFETAPSVAEIRPELELNLEWATPFFTLNWNFIPKTPQDLYLTDNTISINWRISY